MNESNTQTAPERDLHILAEMVKIERLGQTGMTAVPQLIDYLSDDSDHLAATAMKTLHGCLPMAALPVRWPDNEPYKKTRSIENIPDWLTDACDGWGHDGDFAHLCLQKLATLGDEHQQKRYLEKLATFMGARHRILTGMLDTGQQVLARKFAKSIFRLQQIQFPKQVTLAVTMNCQLKCSYCISGCASSTSFEETSPREIHALFDWMQQKGVNRLGLTGGEPTLYSRFESFLEQTRVRGFELYLATNGLASEKMTAAIVREKPLCVTMHLTPDVLGTKKMDTYMGNARDLIAAGVYVIMRCNFLNATDDPWVYLKTAKEAGISEIRTAIPMPKATGGNLFVDSRRLIQYGGLLDRLVDGGRQSRISITLAKPFPICFLAAKTAKHFLSNGSLAVTCPVHFSGYTNNIIVHSDLRYTACLGLDQLSPRPIVEFNSLAHAAGAHRKRVKERMHIPIMKRCSQCPLWMGGRCMGGCLSYRVPTKTPGFFSTARGSS
jgi:Radical SAM superfamily